MYRYTVTDYEQLPHNDVSVVSWELINGVFQMSPSPKIIHQKLSSDFLIEFGMYIRIDEKKCGLFAEPTDVYLREDLVLKPDIFIVCDLEKLTENRCNGIPDLIVEILSPSTKYNDLPGGSKFKVYEKFLLKEYWVVDPLDTANIKLTQYRLMNNILTQIQTYTRNDIIQSQIFPGLRIHLYNILVNY